MCPRDQAEDLATLATVIDHHDDPTVGRSRANRTLASRQGRETTYQGGDASGSTLNGVSPQTTIRGGHESSLESLQSSELGVEFVSWHAVLNLAHARARGGVVPYQLAHTRRERAS
jgi:hypothetical protein